MSLRSPLSLAVLLLSSLSASAQAKPPAVTCVNCHHAEAMSQPESQMGRASELPGNNPTLQSHPRMSFRSGAYTYAIETRDGQGTYSVTDGAQSIKIPVRWAMGSQAQTWVLERNGKLFESQVSYYPFIDGLAITTGDDQWKPKSLEEAIGRPIGDDEARVCFGCHTTDAVVDNKLDLPAAKPGVTCEHCHTGTSAHLAGILQADTHSIPPKLGSLPAEDLSNFCGTCHRSWETVVRNHWHGQADVRFQPYRLANSKCFDGRDPRISCVACHNPHQKLVRGSPSAYDSKCLACHAPLLTASTPGQVHGKVCPTAKSNCTSCHMPKVALPNGLLHFSDHQIRIVKDGQPFPN